MKLKIFNLIIVVSIFSLYGQTQMRKFLNNKLWRDKMPEQMEAKGSIIHLKILNDQEFDEQLRNKLSEETIEVLEAKNREDLICEIADVLEVVDSLCLHHKINREEVLQKQKSKNLERGGFMERKFVTISEHQIGSTSEKYCLAEPNKYPEVK